MAYFIVRLGEGGKYADIAKKNNFVAVGWNEVPDLRGLGSFDSIKAGVRLAYEHNNPGQVGATAGQLYRFGIEMQPHDVVLAPIGSGEYLVGDLGDYYFEDNPKDGCPYFHRRHVSWRDATVSKQDMTTSLTYSLGGTLTTYSLNKYSPELDALLAGKAFTPADKPQRVRDILLAGLLELDGEQFEHFVKHLLDIIGFKASTTRYTRDKGIDVTGVLNADGLADIKLQIQAKRYEKGTVGDQAVRTFKGSLATDEHGCIITTSKFNKDAIEEADKPGHKTIKLIDGDDLAALILKHFDELDDQYKTRFSIRRKKDFNIEDQFESSEGELEDAIEVEDEIRNEPVPAWDTLVCAAQEEGFRSAFMEQKAWWAVRLSTKTIPCIKYLAIYQVAPLSKITHYAEVDRIEPYESTGKYKLYLKGEIHKLKSPVGLGDNPHLKPQGPRYATLDDILQAQTLDQVFAKK